MTLSQGLIRHLQSDTSDEPLPKRLKLAENVIYSPDIPIAHKENCIIKWLCSELSDENASTIWITIYRCLSAEPKTYAKLFPETKNMLIEKLIGTFNEYPQSYVSEEIIKCCPYVISNSHINCCFKENSVIQLIKALIELTLKVLDSDNENENSFTNSVVVECAEQAIAAFVQVCRQTSSEKKNFTLVFIEELIFPLAFLNEKLKLTQLSSKISIETEKCIKRLLLPSIKSATTNTKDENNKNMEETEYIFNALKDAAEVKRFEEVKAAFNCLFQCSVSAFSQNSVLIDIIMRRLVNCIEEKDQSQQILILLLENSTDVSFNFEHEIDGVTLKTYLKIHIEGILSKSKHFKYSDYNLLAAIAKLNPLIIEDLTQNILERIIFDNRKHKKEEIAYEKLFTQLWTASVRLRRQQKFLSKLLITVVNFKEEKDSSFIDKFKLPETFISEFKEDLKSKTTSAQVIGMFHTLNFHLQSDCNNVLKESGPTTQIYLLLKVVARIFVTYFENSSFLDNSLPHEWQQKFHKAFAELRDTLASLAETLCERSYSYEAVIFIAYFDLVKIWCEVHDLLHYYVPDFFSTQLNFPIDEPQIKEFKKVVKKLEESTICQKSLNEVLYFKSTIYDKENQEPIKDKLLFQLWPRLLENNFEHIGSMDELQLFKLAQHLIKAIDSDENEFKKYTTLLKLNVPRMSITFTTAVALQIISNIGNYVESSATKAIIESTDFEKVLQSLYNSDLSNKALKSAKKEIAKQNFKSINECNVEKIKRNLLFLSSLPVSFLDQNIRLYLFMVLYAFEQETKNMIDFKELIHNLYYDFLRQNDIDVMSSVTDSCILLEHFQENHLILTKIIKLSLNDPKFITFWESFIEKEEFNRKVNSILLICIDGLKNKALQEHKTSLQNLAQNLSSKFVKSLDGTVSDRFQIAGLKISVKTVLAEKKTVKSNLKKYVESTIQNLTQSETMTLNDELAQEIIQLSLIVLSHREHFNIDNTVIKKICEIIIANPDEKTFSHFLETLKDNEFGFFAETLTSQTGENLLNGKIEVLDKIVTVWQSLAKAEAKASRSKSLCMSLNNLLNNLIAAEIKDISSLSLLKIFRAFVTSKRLIRLSETIIDSIFVVSMECLDKLNQQTIFICCQEALGLCLDFIRSKTEFVLDRLPVLNTLFKKVFQIILKEAKATQFSDEPILRILAIDIEKFCTFYAKLKKDVARISPYLIADLIDISSRIGVLPSYLKVSIDSAISQLLSNCDRHAVSFLSRTLPTSTQQIFKTIYDNYVKYHKFTGKI